MAFIAFALLLMWRVEAFAWGSPQPKTPDVVSTPAPTPDVVTVPGYVGVKAKITGSVKQVTRLARLTEGMEKTLNHPSFKTRVLGQYYKGKQRFHDTTLTNEQVYEKIMLAREIGGSVDHLAELEIIMEKIKCSTLGYTYPNVKPFWINTCGFDSRKDSGLVGTMCHEWMHKLGFKHAVNYSVSRDYSVPYSVGTICAEIYDELSKAEVSGK